MTDVTVEPLLNVHDVSSRLSTGQVHVERLVDAGMPCHDIGIHDEKKRRRRTLRFYWSEISTWLASRNGSSHES